jgi:hypothetical protein
LLKRTLAAVALSSSVLLILPTAASAVVASSPAVATPDFDGLVRSTVHKGDTIYVAGDFTSVTGTDSQTVQRDGLAAVSASTGLVLPWAPTVRGTVNRVLAAKEGVYVVGDFTAVNGRSRTDVARVDRVTGAVDREFKHSSDGVVNAVALSKRKVYLGGEFTRFDGQPRGQLAAVGRKGTSELRRWAPHSGVGPVSDLVRKRAGVYVAGSFHRIEDTSRSFLALVDGRKGRLVRSFKSRVRNVVLDISVTRTRVYAGTGGRTVGGGATSVKRSDGSVVFERRLDGDVQAITTLKGVVYLGGHFTSICPVGGAQDNTGSCIGGAEAERLRGASLERDGTLTGWDPQLNPDIAQIPGIETFTTYKKSRRLFIAGGFTTAGGTPVGRFAGYAQAS